jgi:membrane-associated phospholipid phosphatase
VLISCFALVVAVGGIIAAGKSHGNALDQPIDSWIVGQLGTHLRALRLISKVGLVTPFVLTPVLVLASLVARRLNAAALAAISVPVAASLTQFVLKPLVHERIGSALTYPSGHTTGVFAVVAVIGVLLLNPPGGRPAPRLRIVVVVLAAGLGGTVGVAMIGLDYHYFTDTVAGLAVATGVVLTTAFGLDQPAMRTLLAWPSRLSWPTRLSGPSLQPPQSPQSRPSRSSSPSQHRAGE